MLTKRLWNISQLNFWWNDVLAAGSTLVGGWGSYLPQVRNYIILHMYKYEFCAHPKSFNTIAYAVGQYWLLPPCDEVSRLYRLSWHYINLRVRVFVLSCLSYRPSLYPFRNFMLSKLHRFGTKHSSLFDDDDWTNSISMLCTFQARTH